MFRELDSWTTHLPTGRYGGVTLSDIDLDGRFEVLVGNAAGPNLVLRFANERLQKISSPIIAAVEHATTGIVAADVDGDGREELLLAGEPGRLLHCGPDGRWTTIRDSSRRAVAFAAESRHTGRHTMLLMHPSGQIDTVVRNENGAIEIVAGPRKTSEVRPPVTVNLDADGDGELDTFLGYDSAPNELLAGRGSKRRNLATPSLAFPTPIRAAVAADFDNDGYEELFLAVMGEPNRLYRIGGDVTLLDSGDASDIDAMSEGAAVADVDGDGRLELILSRGGTVGVFQSRAGAKNAWLRVRPLTRFQAPARGADVSCRVNGRTLVRRIDAGTMSLSLNEPVAHFGLGSDPHVEWVSITWPDGVTLRLPSPDVNCSYTVPYPRG